MASIFSSIFISTFSSSIGGSGDGILLSADSTSAAWVLKLSASSFSKLSPIFSSLNSVSF